MGVALKTDLEVDMVDGVHIDRLECWIAENEDALCAV